MRTAAGAEKQQKKHVVRTADNAAKVVFARKFCVTRPKDLFCFYNENIEERKLNLIAVCLFRSGDASFMANADCVG